MGDEHLLLFNDPAFSALNVRDGQRHVRLDHSEDGVLVGSLCGVIDGDTFTSGFSAPFGGVDLAGDQPLPRVEALLEHALGSLDAQGVRTVRITQRPTCYSPAEPVVQHLLHQSGFAVERSILNHHLDLRGLESLDAYLALWKKKQRWALRKDLEEPYRFLEAVDGDDIAACHAVLRANRAAHGRPPGLDVDYVHAVRAAFPGRVRVFGLEHAGTIVAAAITYRVLPGRELLVTWGDDGDGPPRSPMNLLACRLVEQALATGAELLDLGPSTEHDGTPIPGLVHFKRSLLAEATTRLAFVRHRSG